MKAIRKKQTQNAKQAVLLDPVTFFDVNECGMDWISSEDEKRRRAVVNADYVCTELSHILGKDFDELAYYRSWLILLHMRMNALLREDRRYESNYALR